MAGDSVKYEIGQLRGAWGAGFRAAEKKIVSDQSMIGRYFHSVVDNRVKWQGKVLSHHGDNVYEVQLFSWWTGHAGERRLVTVNEMVGWLFYRSHGEWIEAGDREQAAQLEERVEELEDMHSGR